MESKVEEGRYYHPTRGTRVPSGGRWEERSKVEGESYETMKNRGLVWGVYGVCGQHGGLRPGMSLGWSLACMHQTNVNGSSVSPAIDPPPPPSSALDGTVRRRWAGRASD